MPQRLCTGLRWLALFPAMPGTPLRTRTRPRPRLELVELPGMLRVLPKLLLLLSLPLALAGCAGQLESVPGEAGAVPAADARAAPEAAAPDPAAAAAGAAAASPATLPVPAPPEVVYGSFEADTLYQLLLAELALRRGAADAGADRYAQQARQTRDPGVVANAARLAAIGSDTDRAAELALLWVEVVPDDPDARQAAALTLIRAGRFEAALEQLSALRSAGADAGFSYLAVHAGDVSGEDRAALLAALEALQKRWPQDADLAFARAVLLERAERIDEALAALQVLLPEDYGSDATLLRARLLESGDQSRAAADWLAAAIARGGEVGRLRYALARLLVELGDLDGARAQFDALLEQVGENSEILLSLSLITLEADRLDETLDYLDRLLRSGRRADSAWLYLGLTAERLCDRASALEAWSRVTPGFEFGRAQDNAARLILDVTDCAAPPASPAAPASASGPTSDTEVARLLGVDVTLPEVSGPSDPEQQLRAWLDGQRERHPERALTLWLREAQALLAAERIAAAIAALGAALEEFPDEPDLRYARALAHQRNDDLGGMEEDLRYLIDADPEDALALNALGYTLADRTDRITEARELVERALAIAPDEPAYIDSMGWVEYRAGNLEEAVTLLERAFDALRDHEVAAHLGEALWMQGRQHEARQIWSEGLQLEQPTEVLRETVRRLAGPDALEALRRLSPDRTR